MHFWGYTRHVRRWQDLLTLGLLITVTGCGSGLEWKPIHGAVTLDGQPLAEAAVLFQPIDGGPVASGNTDAQGNFTLTTAGKPGALAGRYQVAVNKSILRGLKPDGTVSDEGAWTEWISPQQYSLPATSGLTAEVTSGGNEFDFSLLSDSDVGEP
jgi:hypothetical protein